MSNTGWQGLSLNFPSGVIPAINTVKSTLEAQQTALTTLKTQAELILNSTLNIPNNTTDLINSTIQLAVTAITNLLESILSDTGVYILQVPLPKKGALSFIQTRPQEDEGTTEIRFPINQIPDNIKGLELFNQIFKPENIYLGGNAYFFKTVAESLSDYGDPNRPKFTKNDYWISHTLIVGSEDVSTALSLAVSIENIFGQRPNSSISKNSVSTVPTDIRGRLSTRGNFPVLEWSPVEGSRILQALGNATIRAKRYAIIKFTDWRCKRIHQIREVFTTNQLTTGLTGKYGATVVYEGEYDGLSTQWSGDIELTTTPVFYTIAFQTSFEGTPGNTDPTVNFGYTDFITAIEFRKPTGTQTTPEVLSQIPDWYRTPTVTAIVPAFNRVMDQILEQLKTFAGASNTGSRRNTEYINFLNTEITKYSSKINEFQQYANDLSQILLSVKTLGSAKMRIATGQGPVSTYLSDLATALSDTANGPPFEKGTEYVCGLVVLAVGPDISGIETLLRTLFSNADTSDLDTQVKNGIDSITTLNALLDQAIEINNNTEGFNTDMTPRANGSDATCE